jgi:hypothetical protein
VRDISSRFGLAEEIDVRAMFTPVVVGCTGRNITLADQDDIAGLDKLRQPAFAICLGLPNDGMGAVSCVNYMWHLQSIDIAAKFLK